MIFKSIIFSHAGVPLLMCIQMNVIAFRYLPPTKVILKYSNYIHSDFKEVLNRLAIKVSDLDILNKATSLDVP